MGIMDLTNNETYIRSCVDLANRKLKDYSNVREIEKDIDSINVYENISSLEEPKEVHVMDKTEEDRITMAKECILEGRFLAEHAAAGEATRLGLGTKYLINIREDLSAKRIAELISEEKGTPVTEADVIKEAGCDPKDLLSISLGTRHMIQYSYDIARLAEELGMDPDEAIGNQKMLIILNESSADEIIAEFIRYRFFGFSPENVYFMVQRSYHGIALAKDGFRYDKDSEKRLHNHGQMVMQQTMDDEIFYIDMENKATRKYLKSAEFGRILKGFADKQSFNIEDLGFLNAAIDYESLATALAMSDDGYRMMMEIVANNPQNPQKGGMAAYDKAIGRNVMIEAFQLQGIKNSDIIFLNKNFNHYPMPYGSWKMIKEKGLNMPMCVKDGLLYFQPVQGDINFLVKTQFVQRKVLKPIQSWKSPATTPLTIWYMKKQDEQPGFREYAERFIDDL